MIKGGTLHSHEAKSPDYAALASLAGTMDGASAESSSRQSPRLWTDAFPVSSPASTPVVLVRQTGMENLIEEEIKGIPSETEKVNWKTISRKLILLFCVPGFPFSFQFHGFK